MRMIGGMEAEEYVDYLSKIKVEGATVTDINGVLSNDTGEVWFTVLMSNTDEITFEMDKRGKPNFSITFLSLDYMRQQKFDKEFKKLYDKSLDPIYAGMGVYVNVRPKMS